MQEWHSEMQGWHTCHSPGCPDCDAYREYLETVDEELREVQDRARGAVALTACCRDGNSAVALRAAAEQQRKRKRDHNNFHMDFENYVLSKWDSRQGIPTGPRRYENKAWAELMKSNLEDSDTTWDIYIRWVSEGGGDEWFMC